MTETVAVIDYGAGNLRSVANALAAVAGEEMVIEVTADPRAVAAADRVVLPGVGAFGQCAAALRAAPGMVEALNAAVIEERRPFLGICVGMQLMADEGYEHGCHRGLGWIGGAVERLTPSDLRLKIPHMGWNAVQPSRPHPVLDDLPVGSGYFVHGYHFVPVRDGDMLATASYGGSLAAVVGRDNLLGVQFHPEKSQAFGLAFLRGFLAWTP